MWERDREQGSSMHRRGGLSDRRFSARKQTHNPNCNPPGSLFIARLNALCCVGMPVSRQRSQSRFWGVFDLDGRSEVRVRFTEGLEAGWLLHRQIHLLSSHLPACASSWHTRALACARDYRRDMRERPGL